MSSVTERLTPQLTCIWQRSPQSWRDRLRAWWPWGHFWRDEEIVGTIVTHTPLRVTGWTALSSPGYSVPRWTVIAHPGGLWYGQRLLRSQAFFGRLTIDTVFPAQTTFDCYLEHDHRLARATLILTAEALRAEPAAAEVA